MINTYQRAKSAVPAKHLFFPAAALLAAIGPWLFVISISSNFRPVIDASIHAKSMLFGFIGALIAGYLLGRIPKKQLTLLFALWLMGRLTEVLTSNLLLINLSYSLFGLMLAIIIAPKFLVAKKWRNISISPLIAVIGCFPLISWLLSESVVSFELPVYSYILLLTLLMFFMGGRFITPAATRAFADIGLKIPHRVQPALEAGTMIILALAITLSFIPALRQWAGLFCGIAAVLIALRLYRWKIIRLNWKFIDIWALTIGYAWLGLGLLILSISLITNYSVASSLHAITIGAVGTLSTCVILRTINKHTQPAPLIYLICLVLIGIAAGCRLSTPFIPANRLLLLNLAALSFSFNFIIVFIYCMQYSWQKKVQPENQD